MILCDIQFTIHDNKVVSITSFSLRIVQVALKR